MLVPAILPIAIAPASLTAASIPTASSGRLVPIDTTVRPTSSGDTPSRVAILAPPRTSASAPTTSASRPAAISAYCCIPDPRVPSGSSQSVAGTNGVFRAVGRVLGCPHGDRNP